MNLSNRHVVIVGAETDVGQAAAEYFNKWGSLLSLVCFPEHDQRKTFLESHQADRWLIRELSWKEPQRIIDEIMELHGRIDTLIFIPPLGKPKPFLEIAELEWDNTFSIILELGLRFIQEIAKVVSPDQAIVFALPALSVMSFEGTSLLSAACAALETVCQVAAVDLGPRGVRVNTVVYGWMDSDYEDCFRIRNYHADIVAGGIPLGRLADPAEVAFAIGFLAGSETSYITGIQLKVDGGYLVTKGIGPAFPDIQ